MNFAALYTQTILPQTTNINILLEYKEMFADAKNGSLYQERIEIYKAICARLASLVI